MTYSRADIKQVNPYVSLCAIYSFTYKVVLKYTHTCSRDTYNKWSDWIEIFDFYAFIV